MKRFFSLLTLLVAVVTMGGYVHAQGTYKVAEDGTATENQQITSVPNITVTFGTGTFKLKKKNILGYPFYFEANTNPGGDGYDFKKGKYIPSTGAFYKIEPKKDGTIEYVGVFTQSKEAIVVEDGKLLTNIKVKDADGNETAYPSDYKFTTKLYGQFTFNVKAGSIYYVLVNGSKIGFSGFNYIVNDITISSAKMATYCNKNAWVVPSDLEVYTAKYADSKITLNQVAEGTVVPAGEGVVLYGEPKTYTLNLSTEEGTKLADNDLIGATEETTRDNNTTYILVKDKATQKVMFGQLASGQKVKANSAYLTINDINAAKSISIDFGGTTGINAIDNAANAKDGEYYTLSGQRTMKPVKGIYILNGKKYIAK